MSDVAIYAEWMSHVGGHRGTPAELIADATAIVGAGLKRERAAATSDQPFSAPLQLRGAP